ncbi:MAG: hypothetical protein PHQ03_03210 [Methylococcales bacterium]|nr:hypothetical protein [Methylococcales bacterium]
MKNYQFLVAAFLLGLAQIALGAGNAEYINTPYYNISTQKPKSLKENTTRSGQISVYDEVDFFEIVNTYTNLLSPFPLSDVELVFSCPQADSKVSMFGWYISVWKHYSDSSKADEKLKGYDQISQKKCVDKFTFVIDQNDNAENKVASYYIGIQSACSTFPKRELQSFYMDTSSSVSQPQECDTSDYKLKLGVIPKEIVADTNTLTATELKNAISLGAIKTGQVSLMTDKNIYSVETNSTTDTAGTNEVPLLFSCTAAAARYTNDWELTVYDDKNTVVTGYPRYINGSDCGSTLVDDKGGFKFTLPKDSPRYFISVQSACDSQSKKDCTVETSQYNIARDVTKIYTGSLSATKSITSTTANFKLTRCGLNANSTLAVKIENADLRTMFKNKIPMKIQIGTTACQILTPDSFSPAELMLGSITGNAEIIDAVLTAKDSASVTLGECAPSNKPENEKAIKVTLTGTKLDLESLNPTTTAATTGTTTAVPSSNSVVIPVKVDIGDFHCEGRDAFYIDTDKPKIGDKTYSNRLSIDSENYSTPINLELSKTDKIESATDVRLYYVDSSINNDTVLNFSCDASTRFNNDWKVFVYNSDKTLNGAPYIINGSDCATGKDGDNGVYKITIPKDKNSVRYFVAVKSACDEEDSACVVDHSTYILSRELAAATSTTGTSGTTTPTKTTGSFDTAWLTTKKNLGATLQTGQINDVTDVKVYQVDTGTEDANLTFSCNNSVLYQNDWKLLIYDSTKTLKSTTMINGSSCATGTGYAISPLTKDSPTYYLVVKSACDVDGKTCEIDKSQYQLKRITATQAATNAATKPCFGTNCAAVTTPVKPFFK